MCLTVWMQHNQYPVRVESVDELNEALAYAKQNGWFPTIRDGSRVCTEDEARDLLNNVGSSAT